MHWLQGAGPPDSKLTELKQLLVTVHYDSEEQLEDAVEALLWREAEADPNIRPGSDESAA